MREKGRVANDEKEGGVDVGDEGVLLLLSLVVVRITLFVGLPLF